MITLALVLVALLAADAQPARVYRVGIVHQGGAYSQTVDGLRDGLKELGLEEGKQVVFDVRDAKGDLKAVTTSAQSLEASKVDLIVSVASSTTLAVKRATRTVAIVFYAGTDPVKLGFVDSFSHPGGRLTGIHGQYTDLTAKRLELLKEIAPGIRRPLALYNPANAAALRSLAIAREAARQLKLTLVEKPVASPDELSAVLRTLRPGEVDSIAYVADATLIARAKELIETSIARKLPLMLGEIDSVPAGGLAGYAESTRVIGRRLAKYVQRVLLGAAPGMLPVEQLDRLHFVVNLRTARAIGLTIPQAVLARADDIIE